ncbi:MAG: hypothetical protein CVV21_09845 [Candidatus Goldiibacteriota bacterium HGW-Goldbacteria-1]|nr:MAG: hypothetical protein CVV21_09845 [Candidatus Goldiibacteriota bacterium HGW-Goldbacteria-1]
MKVTPENILTEQEKIMLQAGINTAESRTTGRIRVHIEKKAGRDPFERARAVFETYSLNNSTDKNCVLLYISTADRKFVVFADDGINGKVPEGFWKHVSDSVTGKLKEGQFSIGLTAAVNLTGSMLADFFPAISINEAAQ